MLLAAAAISGAVCMGSDANPAVLTGELCLFFFIVCDLAACSFHRSEMVFIIVVI